MSEVSESSKECLICRGSFDSRFVVHKDQSWTIRHSEETDIAGYFIIQSNRHILDLGSADETETITYGPLLKKLMSAIREISDCRRIYTFSLADMVPHYHLHVIPRSDSFPKEYIGRGITSYPTNPGLDEASIIEQCRKTKEILNRKD